jgi:hypothetical protein
MLAILVPAALSRGRQRNKVVAAARATAISSTGILSERTDFDSSS